ncbi:MAG: glycosyltransferase, partial [Ruminococcus sp.]|nr:glycosyltransferase [Ruminococcus sp.]
DAVSGSFMIVPRFVYEEVSGFDEDYFMYGEDIDLCYRIKNKGYSIIYFADLFNIRILTRHYLCIPPKPHNIGHA